MPLIDVIGWLGSVLVVAAYAFNIAGKMSADSMVYIILNIIGSGCLIANTIYHHAIPSAAVNIVWIAIALVALVRPLKKKTS
ncbi:MAG: hypothetical protein QM764_02580 [Chitinophagaceae bacterium]